MKSKVATVQIPLGLDPCASRDYNMTPGHEMYFQLFKDEV